MRTGLLTTARLLSCSSQLSQSGLDSLSYCSAGEDIATVTMPSMPLLGVSILEQVRTEGIRY